MFELDASWNEKAILLPSGSTLILYERKESNPSESDMLIRTHQRVIIANGGALLRRFGDMPALQQVTHAGGIVAFESEAPEVHLWYFPRCSFDQSLELLDVVGFPKGDTSSNPEQTRALTKAILLELAQNRQITPAAVGPEHVTWERIGGNAFSSKEVSRVLDFNQEHFKVNREKWELRDYRRVFRTKDFVVVGPL